MSFKDVLAERQWFFRVYGLNGPTGPTDGTGSPNTASADRMIEIGLAASSERNDATTDSAVLADAAPYLTAQDARDTNELGANRQGVLVIWTSPANPAGAPVLGYRVESSVDGADFEVLPDADNLNTGETHYVDDDELPEGETRVYRVTSINSVGVGTEMATITIPLPADHSHAPVVTELTEPSITDVSVSNNQITVTWDDGANADSHSAILFSSGSTDPPYEILEETTSGSSPHTTFAVDVEAGMSYAVVIHSISGSSYMYDLEWETIPAN